MRENVHESYFNWLCNAVYSPRYSHLPACRKMMAVLHARPFRYILEMDKNLADHGIELRAQFAYERGYDDAFIEDIFYQLPCSCLEMMVALSLICEDRIMWDPDLGNRTNVWFFGMCRSLGIFPFDSDDYDEEETDEKLSIFLDREYDPDGRGGLFYVPGSTQDLRDMEVWYQMHLYLQQVEE